MPKTKDLNKNLAAFLDMIAESEGTAHLGKDCGYNVIVGGTLFNSYETHPNKRIWLSKFGINSTAAGRYQLLNRYYIAYKKLLGLKDFSPESQDAIAIQQIKECRALEDIYAGRLEKAISRTNNIWASFAGAGYGQHEHKIENLRRMFELAGGVVQ